MPAPERPPVTTAWIAVDWGTTHLRAWAISETGDVIAAANSNKGMARLKPEEFEPALLELIEDWGLGDDPMTVMACGMVGARQGWQEADYLPVPSYPLVSDHFVHAPTKDPRLSVSIVPGLKQLTPPDVMRGEETQIAGFLAQAPEFDGVLCMPGTHTKWVRVSGGRVLGFQSFMTGELFALLEQQSVLKHSVFGEALDQSIYRETLQCVRAEPKLSTTGLFRLRADDLLNTTEPAHSRARLSAYLIGSEVASGTELWPNQSVALVGAPSLVELYALALDAVGCSSAVYAADDLTLRGLAEAHSIWKKGNA